MRMNQIALTVILLVFVLCLWSSNSHGYIVGRTQTGKVIKWKSNSVTVYINPTDGPTWAYSAIVAAANTWNDVSTSSFKFNTTTSNISYSSYSRTYPRKDGYNLVTFGPIESKYVWCGIAGQTYTWTYTPLNSQVAYITEVDMRINTNYGINTDGSSSGYDLQSIATHEFGHWLRLMDLYNSGDTEKTMYGRISFGQTNKRSLDQDDIDGITYLYP